LGAPALVREAGLRVRLQVVPLSVPPQPSVAQRAFDVVAAAPAIRTLPELDEVVGRELRAFGWELVLGVQVAGGPEAQDVALLFGETRHRWVQHYYEHGYAACCPVAAAASVQPVSWREIRAGRLTRRGRTMFEELRAFDLHEGHIVAIDKGPGQVAAVSLAGGRVEMDDPEVVAATHFLSIWFGLVGLKLAGAGAEPAAALLSPRQLECLKWVRAGKSSSDIGDILGLSARTVDEHLGEACRKLGVKTRIQAVAEAALRGLLQL
jgi:DNA-binding CsgD family transcriptional regulator